MAQQILLKRGSKVYENYLLLQNALNNLAWTPGEPVVASYLNEKLEKRTIIAIGVAIGIENANNSDCYRVILEEKSVNDAISSLQGTLSVLADTLSDHVETLANGTGKDAISGHVINSDESEIEFTNGIGKIKNASIALNKLATSASSGILGYKSSDLNPTDGAAPVKVLTWDDIASALIEHANFKPFNGAVVGGIEPTSDDGKLRITLGDGLIAAADGDNAVKISIDGELGGQQGALNVTTAEGSQIIFSGTTDALKGEFPSALQFKSAPSITEGAVSVGDPGDNDDSALIPTVSYVREKIKSAIAETDAMTYKGVLDPTVDGFTLPSGNSGDTYKISKNGSILGLGDVHVGDMVICTSDDTSANTPASWDLIEVHDGSISAPVSAVDGNIAVFTQGGAALVDSNVQAEDLLLKGSTTIVVNDGLTGGGVLGNGELTISHNTVEVTDETTGDVITDITVNEYGHVTSITRGEGSKITLEREADENLEGAWVGNSLAAGLQISGVSLESNTLKVFASKVPGKVRLTSESELKYLGEAITGKSKDLLNTDENIKGTEYSVSVEQDAENGIMQLSVVIDKIDGGTF